MAILSPFLPNNNDRLLELTNAVNRMPVTLRTLSKYGLFSKKRVSTRSIMIDMVEGQYKLIESAAPNTKGRQIGKTEFSSITMNVPYFPLEGSVSASDVAGVRAFGTEGGTQPFTDAVTKTLANMRRAHDLTLEYLQWGAIKGLVLDGAGNTMVDLFDAFEFTQETFDFNFSDANLDVGARCRALKYYYETNIKGEILDYVHVFVGQGFFDELVGHAKVVTAFERYQSNSLAREDKRSGFEFQGVVFEVANDTFTDANGNVVTPIPTAGGRAIPIGTSNVFETYFAPAEYPQTVNTPGRQFYARQALDQNGKTMRLYSEMNALPIMTRPELSVEITQS